MKSKKHVLVLSPRPNQGGAAQVLLNLLHEWSTEASPLKFLFLFEESGPALATFQAYGSVCIFPIEQYPLIKKILIRLSPRLYRYLKQLYAGWVIRGQKPALLYVNSMTHTPAVRAAVSSSVPLILHAHELEFQVVNRLSEAWIYKVLHRSSRIIACAQAVANFYSNTYAVPAEKITVLHGPVNLQRLVNNSPKAPAARSPLPDTVVLGVVANLYYLKGPDLLIEAMVKVLEAYGGSLKLCWLGAPKQDTPYLLAIRKLIQSKGLSDYIDIQPASSQTAAFYQNLDIFVLPSRTEAFPLVILEAMLFEKPVVAMDVGGIREVVDSKTGYLVKDRTPEGLARGIMHFVKDKKLRRQTGKNGRMRVLNNFEAEIQTPKWLEILENL
ncbi:glycosyltransferase family 4 protein [Persicitalea jodogahamensis]|nr:glycosyltransferase family 4 protein [Persicitalea jodogahamensis]